MNTISSAIGDWWPSVYLSVKQAEPGGPVELLTKGRLPYTLHWFFRVTESHRPHGFCIEAWAISRAEAHGPSNQRAVL